MSDGSERVDLSSLPDWARQAFEAAMQGAEGPAPSVLDHRSSPAWPLLVDAAVVTGFLPRDLAPGLVEGAARGDAEKAVLDFAERTHAPDGVRWSLTRDARTAILGRAGREEIDAALDRTGTRFTDSVTRALRDCVRGETGAPMACADLSSLEAMRVAVSLLAGTPSLTLPRSEELDRDIELRRLLAQFERMTGVVPTSDLATPQKLDRFFGRTGEMEQLRAYVDAAAAESWLESARRATQRVVRAITGRTPMSVWGIGGVGKTTLVAKFMLQHARAAASRFPFAYLDFDRATVSARNRAGLLIEMSSQVGAQFPELYRGMLDLRQELRELARKMEASPSGESIGELTPYALKFRTLVDRHLEDQESLLERSRPILLVFDTFEIVQYTPRDVGRLEELVRAFSRSDESSWPRLRLVISGRKQVSSFAGDVTLLPLGALDREGSEQMLAALAADAGKPITARDAAQLVSAIARRVGGRDKGVHPLRLRLVGEVFRESASVDGPALVASLLDELSRPESAEGQTGSVLIDGILVRRILDHIREPRVRALADPGLVVRRITPDVIREVMARGIPKPTPDRTDPGDSLDITPWVIDEAEAEDIFAAFRREASLVEDDGQSLRHRQDVRQEMLPLIRARRPNRFRALHQLAYDFFRRRAEVEQSDQAAAAEAIYHGLWLALPLATIDRFWRLDQRFNPRIDPDEFEAVSAAAIYLRAKTTRERLAPKEVRQLPPPVALDWLLARSEHMLADPQVNEGVEAARAAAGDGFEALDAHIGVVAVVTRLLHWAGFWADAAALVRRHLERIPAEERASLEGRSRPERSDPHQLALTSLVRMSATLDAKSGLVTAELEALLPIAVAVRDPLVRVELLAHVAIGYAHTPRLGEIANRLRAPLDDAVRRVPADSWRREIRILRLAILTTGHPVPDLLALYFDAIDRLPRDSVLRATMARVFGELHGKALHQGSIESLLEERENSEEAATRFDELWRDEKRRFLEAVRTREDLSTEFWRLVAFDHHDWVHPLGNSLSRDRAEVFSAFDDWKPLSRWWARTRRLPLDGVSIVQSAMDFGVLLQVAEAIAARRPTSNRDTLPTRGYPQDVFGIAAAFTEWHRTIVERLAPLSPREGA